MKEKLAMPCTEKQWEQEIKPRIEKIEGVVIENVLNWGVCKYIVNNYAEIHHRISNMNEDGVCNSGRIKIPYDPDRFCASLGEEQTKWMPLTRGGYEYKIYEEFDGKIFGRVKMLNGTWSGIDWYKGGKIFGRVKMLNGTWSGIDWYKGGMFYGEPNNSHNFDLIPYNPEQEAIKQEIAIKEKELEELKSRLK